MKSDITTKPLVMTATDEKLVRYLISCNIPVSSIAKEVYNITPHAMYGRIKRFKAE